MNEMAKDCRRYANGMARHRKTEHCAGTLHRAAAEIERLEARVAELEMLETDFEHCVKDRISELNAEGEAFDREAANALIQLCDRQPGFDWGDYPEGITTQDAYDYLSTCFDECDALGKEGSDEMHD